MHPYAFMSPDGSSPLASVSVVIPVYNESGILREATTALRDELLGLGLRFEIILAENGSTDHTADLAQKLAEEFPEIKTFSCSAPDYGLALKEGIQMSEGDIVVCDEIDLCDIDFYKRALSLLFHDDADFVVGSKAMKGANDERPWVRRFATRVINGMLRVSLDFRGTDTHGLKAFVRKPVLPVVEDCIVTRDLFASELVIRAYRQGLRVIEIPIRLAEKRKPAINLAKRVPRVLTGLGKLTMAIRFGKK